MHAHASSRQWAKADKFVMIGASHGGFLTLEYALTYPQHLYAIIVGDSSAQQSHWGAINMTRAALTDPRVKVDPEQILRMFSGRMTSQEDMLTGFPTIAPLYSTPDHLKALVEVDAGEVIAKAMNPIYETVNAAMGDCLSRYDVRDKLHEIKLPAFVYVGRHDWITPPFLSEELHAGISNSKLVVYENSGHLAALEEQTKFQKDVREFVNSIGIEGLKV